jgi:hypothetical protein
MADKLRTKLAVLPLLPTALSFDRAWTRGVPARAREATAYLMARTGHDFPAVGRLNHGRAIRAITTTIRDNLDPGASVLGLEAKCLAGTIYSTVVGDAALALAAESLAARAGVSSARIGEAARYASGQGDLSSLDPKTRAALALTREISPSPTALDEAVFESTRTLEPAAIVELVVWLGVLQMLHRLGAYYRN